jgi:hypothetical protein
MRKLPGVLALSVLLGLGSPGAARAVDLDELSKYLAFIEGFQYLFEFCQAEATLPKDQVTFAREHIGERRALIFAGLDEDQRKKITTDAVGKKTQMIEAMMRHVARELPGRALKDLCKEGFFQGVMESEQNARSKEVGEIMKAKN